MTTMEECETNWWQLYDAWKKVGWEAHPAPALLLTLYALKSPYPGIPAVLIKAAIVERLRKVNFVEHDAEVYRIVEELAAMPEATLRGYLAFGDLK